MIQPAPPSPAPSNDDHRQQSTLMSVPRATSQPRDGMAFVQNAFAPMHPKLGYPTHGDDFPSQGSSQYYSQKHHSLSLQTAYPVDQRLLNPFGHPSGDLNYSAHAPYTPEASPPSPSPAPESRSSRSRDTRARPAKPLSVSEGRVTKNKKKKKKPAPILSRALSEIAKEMVDVPVHDMGAFVVRSVEQRLQETARNKEPGAIKRPMNAFMLYRKAYQDVAKAHYGKLNHQKVSQMAGNGWSLESDELRNMYTEWAKVERENHRKAHPDYRFSPSKPKKIKSETNVDSAHSDATDPDYCPPHYLPPHGLPRVDSRQVSRFSETPSLTYETHPEAIDAAAMGPYPDVYRYHMPPRAHTFPSQVDSSPYGQHVYHTSLDGLPPPMMTRHVSPAPEYATQAVGDGVEFIDAYYHRLHQNSDPFVDGPLHGAMYGHVPGDVMLGAAEANWHNPMDGGYDAAPLGEHVKPSVQELAAHEPSTHEASAQEAYLRGTHEDWHVEELGGSGQFDDWFSQTEQGLV